MAMPKTWWDYQELLNRRAQRWRWASLRGAGPWVLLVALAIAAALLLGCVPEGDYTPHPQQAEAERIVWREVYGMGWDHPPPPVEWIPAFFWDVAGHRVSGTTLPGWKVQVASGGADLMRITGTSYAHELLHWRAWLLLGDADPQHFREDWNVAERAVQAMLDEGM
jgi:hypothetical protein